MNDIRNNTEEEKVLATAEIKAPVYKEIYIELLRVIAIILVTVNHLPIYMHFYDATGFSQVALMAFSLIVRINVPIFFMISGAVLLGKEESYLTVLRKRVLRFVFLIVVIRTIVFFATKSGTPSEFTFNKYINMILGNGAGNYWFLYAYLGFLLVLPFMRRIARGMTKPEFFAILIVHFIISSFQLGFNALMESNKFTISFGSDLNLTLFTLKASFYPLIGYYIDKKIDITNVKKKFIFSINIIAIIALVFACLFTYYFEIKNGPKKQQRFVQMFDYVITIAAFITTKYIVTKSKLFENNVLKRIICFLGSLSFGIYIFDQILKIIMWDQYRLATESVPVVLSSLGWLGITVVICGTFTALIKLIPGIKRYI